MSQLHFFSIFFRPMGFLRLSSWSLWVSGLSALVLLLFGFNMALQVPPDYLQGATVKIMFLHVPAAYLSSLCYFALAIFSAGFLIWRLPMLQIWAESCAEIGVVFTAICLLTGAIWGKPTWGTYWVWDARLTSVFILFILYLGYLVLLSLLKKNASNILPAAVLAVIGAINLPIIRFSVNWWQTLHQPASLLRAGGSSFDKVYLMPLIILLIGFSFLAVWWFFIICRTKIYKQLLLNQYR